MSTNFYWHPTPHEELHIGKRFGVGGGLCSYSFQGHKEDVDTPIDSWSRWKACLRSGGQILDEYGRAIEVEDFIAEVETTTVEHRRRQYDWVVAHPTGRWDDDYLCADGFSFSYREFS